METVRLRTLTWKSRLGFGKYADLTIQQIFDLQHTNYLRWVYFNNNRINYIPEILDAIRLFENYRIEKPGKNPEKHETLSKQLFAIACKTKSHDGVLNSIKMVAHLRKSRKVQNFEKHKSRVKFEKKGWMQRKNQGH